MYKIWEGSRGVLIKQYPLIDCGYASKKSLPVKHVVDEFESLEEAEKKLCSYTNTIKEFEQRFSMTEYYISDDAENILKVNDRYQFESKRDTYTPEEFECMKLLMEHLTFYVRLSSIIAYERYGFLKKEENSIVYEDERQKYVIDLGSKIIEERKTDYESNHFIRKYDEKS